MKLFSSTQMAWQEPMFFVIRLRQRWGWTRRAILALAITLVMFLAIYFTRKPQVGIGTAVAMSMLAGLVLVAMMDVGNIQREVTIKEDSIIYNSAMGTSWMGSFALKDIQHVRLMRPEDWDKPFGAMMIQTSDDLFLLGVPAKVSFETVANVLHRLKVNVQLEGWAPSETDTRLQIKDEIVFPAEAKPPVGSARIWPVDEQEERLTPPMATAIGIIIALGPLFLSLLGLIVAVVYLILRWGALAALSKWMIIGGVLGAIVLSFVYLVLAGQFLAARYMIGVATSVLRTRPNPNVQCDGLGDELVAVEIFDRSAWTSTIVKSIDFGFLQVDKQRGLLRFEGNKNRWQIPLAALTKCRIEEAHVGSEGNQNAEKRYYVVIAADRGGEPWEAGMINTRTQLGSDGKEQRYARAQALFDRISSVVAPE